MKDSIVLVKDCFRDDPFLQPAARPVLWSAAETGVLFDPRNRKLDMSSPLAHQGALVLEESFLKKAERSSVSLRDM